MFQIHLFAKDVVSHLFCQKLTPTLIHSSDLTPILSSTCSLAEVIKENEAKRLLVSLRKKKEVQCQ